MSAMTEKRCYCTLCPHIYREDGRVWQCGAIRDAHDPDSIDHAYEGKDPRGDCPTHNPLPIVSDTAQKWASLAKRAKPDAPLITYEGRVEITWGDVRRWATLEQQAARLQALEAVAEIALTGHGDNPDDLSWRDGCLMCEALQALRALDAASQPAGGREVGATPWQDGHPTVKRVNFEVSIDGAPYEKLDRIE